MLGRVYHWFLPPTTTKFTPIALLLAATGPSHISRLVVAVVVDAVEAHLPWTRTKSCEELLKRRKSESDSSSAIVRKFLVVRIGTPMFRASVGLILRCPLAVLAG